MSRLDLVTGAAGFSGSYLVRELLAEGREVIATDLPGPLRSPQTRAVAGAIGLDLDHPRLRIVPADLLDPASLDALFERRPTHVFHTASLYDYSASLARLRSVNVDGQKNLLAAMRKVPPERYVHWSTCGVFGKPHPPAARAAGNTPFDEACPSPRTERFGAPGPSGAPLVNAYSITKWEQEQLAWRAARNEGLPLTVIRPAPIYGPGSDYGHGGIILAVAWGLLPAIPADTKNFITTSVHVEDVARFACFAAGTEATLGEDYNVVDDSIISYHEFLHYIALLVGRRLRDLPLVRLPHLTRLFEAGARGWAALERRLGVPRVRVFEVQSAVYIASSYWLSNRKSQQLGFEYHYPNVREGLKDTVAWMRRQGWFADRRRVFAVSPEGAKPRAEPA